ncbi:MAG: SGNH/GDSL hydrolase family protein [Bacteroidaceae bacterium]|nr:SGNH/GDSL hydrolase family protein [Bacteroidaceae bacterium]
MRKFAFALVALMAVALTLSAKSDKNQVVATWTTAIQKVEPHNLAPAPYLAGNSLRQIVEVSFGGKEVSLKLSNEYNTEETEIVGVELARALSKGGNAEIDESTVTALTFGGKKGVTMKPGEVIVSDPVKFRLTPRMDVAITIHFGKVSQKDVTGHPGSRTSSYIAKGNTNDFSGAVETAHWYYINSLLVKAGKGYGAIAAIGNSITDGRGTTTNGQDRWTDVLSERLLKNKKTKKLSVLNLGLGGNCVLRGGLGPTANSRYDRDVLNQEGVKYAIVFEGVNDLGGSRDGVATANSLIESYKVMIRKAHEKGIKIYGGTIMPFKGNGYYNESREKGRQMVNEWIRTSGEFDGVIDFDAATRDAEQPDRLNPDFLFENDWLHPNADGYRTMGEAIDLKMFYEK